MVDEKKRRFLKHLGIVGAAGVAGLAVSQVSTRGVDTGIDELEDAEQQRGYRRVWATKRDRDREVGTYAEYLNDAERFGIWRCPECGYIYDVTDSREARFDELPSSWKCDVCGGAGKDAFVDIGIAFISGGQPYVNDVACAYHFDEDGDGQFQESEEGVFCTMPCRTICPVDAISKAPRDSFPNPKIIPKVEYCECIGCGRCHKICGYNVIEWVNEPFQCQGTGGQHGGGGGQHGGGS